MIKQLSETPRKWLALPELNIAIFAFLLNFVWEIWQVPFFENIPNMPHWEAARFCTQATFGDVVITLIGFWIVAIVVGSRTWILQPGWKEVIGFLSIGLLITIGMEAIATSLLERWYYAESMPVLPILGTGLLPLAQWVFLPLLVIWFVWRQLN